jgi:hypothetical protein
MSLPLGHAIFKGATVFMYCEVIESNGETYRGYEHAERAKKESNLVRFFTLYGYLPGGPAMAVLDGSFPAIRDQAEALRQQGAEVRFITRIGQVVE